LELNKNTTEQSNLSRLFHKYFQIPSCTAGRPTGCIFATAYRTRYVHHRCCFCLFWWIFRFVQSVMLTN